MREFGVSGEFDPNVAAGPERGQITGENVEDEAAKQRLRYLNEIFLALKAKKEVKKPKKTNIFQRMQSLNIGRRD